MQFYVGFCRKGVSMDTLDTPLDPPLELCAAKEILDTKLFLKECSVHSMQT